MTWFKRVLKLMGVGILTAIVYHESKTLFEIRKDMLKHQHWMNTKVKGKKK